MKPEAEWTDDCSGKRDFDGPIISVSSRFWPRGGSHDIFHGGQFVSDETDPERQATIPPSAKSAIVLNFRNSKGHRDYIELTVVEIEGETAEEVQSRIEQWVEEQMTRIQQALKGEYSR